MEEEKKLLRHNAIQVGKFLEFRDPVIQKGTAGSFFQYEADRKSESRVTMSERGHIFWSDKDGENIHFINHVGPILLGLQGTNIYKPAQLLEHDPTALRRWRAGETENDIKWMKRFDRLCKFVAVQLEKRYPGLRVFCVIWPELEEARPKTNQAHGEERTWNKNHSYRLIGPEVERVKEEETCSLKAAIARVADMTDNSRGLPCSFPRVEAAYYFWKSEQKEEERESA